MAVHFFSEALTMQKRTFLTAACGLLLLQAVPEFSVAAPVAVIESYESSALNATPQQIHEAILQAAKLRKWGIKSDQPGKVLLVYPTNNRSIQYQATVGVTYGKGFYKVEYVTSRGLNEKKNGCYGKEGVICAHRNVNRWIANLGKDLQRLLMK